MAKTGRKAKPTALKLIQGNPGNRPINPDEPEPARAYNPEPPEWLNDDAKAKWREMARVLGEIRVLTITDLDALAMYCSEWVRMMDALRDLHERGKLLRTPRGAPMWNPSWSQYKHSQSQVRSLQAEFGLTPSTRTAIVATGNEEGKDRWSDF